MCDHDEFEDEIALPTHTNSNKLNITTSWNRETSLRYQVYRKPQDQSWTRVKSTQSVSGGSVSQFLDPGSA